MLLDRMESIVREEIARTELSLLAATRDSRLGFQFEQDYVYTPYSLTGKAGSPARNGKAVDEATREIKRRPLSCGSSLPLSSVEVRRACWHKAQWRIYA